MAEPTLQPLADLLASHPAEVSTEGVGEIEAAHRMGIARMGAAAWLRERVAGEGQAR